MPPPFARFYRQFRPRGRALWDMLPWYAHLRDDTVDGVVVCKQGKALLRCYAVHGQDWQGINDAILGARMMQASDALKRLNGSFFVHTESRRDLATRAAPVTSKYPIVNSICAAREDQLAAKPGTWESWYFVSLTWTPWVGDKGKAHSAPSVKTFMEAADDFIGYLKGGMTTAEALTTEEQLSYLASTVNDGPMGRSVAEPEPGTRLDRYLVESAWNSGTYHDGWDARLGAWHVRLASLTGYPHKSWSGMMRELDSLPLGYRWCTHWTKIEAYLHKVLLQEIQRKRLGQEKSILQHASDHVTKFRRRVVDHSPERDVEDLDALRQELGANIKALGRFQTTLMTWGASKDEADANQRRILHTLRRQGFMVQVESPPTALIPHHTAAWLSTIPGTGDHGTRRLLQTSLTAAHLWPGLQAAYSGPAQDEFLQAPVWLRARTDGHTLMRIANHGDRGRRDVGHFLMPGPTGSGKTTFANLLRALWMQYRNAQAVTFDVKRGGRLLTHLLGGQWYDLGQLNFQIQPLRELEDAQGRSMALHWVLGLLEEAKTLITGEALAYVTSNLGRVALLPASQRTLTALITAMADHTRGVELRAKGNPLNESLVKTHVAVQTALQPFTQRGLYGHIFDTNHDTLDMGTVLTFEMEGLLSQPRLIGPILRHVYPRIYRRMSTDAPMLLINDDAAIPWAVQAVQKQSEDWLRLTRDKAVSMGFLTHSIVDVFNSPLGQVLLDSCPARFLLPNTAALDDEVAPVYSRLGLGREAIRLLATARPQEDVFYTCTEQGARVIHVGLSPFLRDVLARNSAEDHRQMDRILAEEGPEGFADAWLAFHGYPLTKGAGDAAMVESLVGTTGSVADELRELWPVRE